MKEPKWFVTEITLRRSGHEYGDITYDVRNKVWDAWLRGVGPIRTYAHASEARHAVEEAIDLNRKKAEEPKPIVDAPAPKPRWTLNAKAAAGADKKEA